MKTWKSKGNRIRASDKSLVHHFCIGWLLLLFVAVFLLLNLRQLLVIDWKDFNLLHAGITWTAYNSITVLIATGVCALVAFLYYRYGYDRIKRLLHRQKLARMVLENKWYEVENTKDSGFFTDLQSRSREKIVWFPKIYYQMDNGLLHILCEITMGKYQEQLLSLEDKLESGLYCELTDKTLHDGYIEYTLLYDMIANRISIDEVVAENGGLRLMKNLVWEYDSLPHALICGGTGGGKTYFLLTIIEALLKTNADLYILDPKNADLADLETVMGNVYHTKDDMIDCVNAFYEGMVTRSEEMKLHPNYRTGENYAYLGLAPQFLMNLSADVLKHQPMVEKYARENGITEYVNVLLAIIQVESGGTATDVMQSSESLGLPPNSLSTEESIKQGCKYFASLLSSCKAKGMNDINVVIQSYNYGGGYADYVAKNGKKHSFNLAENFAKNKSGGTKVTYTNPIAVSKNGGWRYNYGNMFYVELVNQYLTVKQFSNETVQAVMNEALKYQGWKYVYGGSNPNTSFDCSGLTQWCYGKAGISLPRTAQAQYDATQHIPLSQAQAGDLVFFHSTYNTSDYVTHVGIYVGNNQMYHAGNPIGYTDLTSAYWQQHIICAGRIKQ